MKIFNSRSMIMRRILHRDLFLDSFADTADTPKGTDRFGSFAEDWDGF
jgi:hypothetical protein